MFYLEIVWSGLLGYYRLVRYWFSRTKPRIEATTIWDLNPEDAGNSLIRVSGRYINGQNAAPEKFQRQQLVHIVNRKNGRSVLRYVLGAGSKYKRMPASAVGLDYDAKLRLGIDLSRRDKNEELDLAVRPAFPWEEKRFYCFEHHSSSERLAHINGYRGVVLGWIGLLLGAMSFF